MRSTTLIVLMALTAPVALAQTPPAFPYPPENDTVSLSLQVEDWVQTATARTEVSIDAAMPGSDAGKVRGDMLAALKGLAQNADWRFTAFDRDQDASGLERWHAVLEARLPEAQLGGLADRTKQASRPGMQIKVQDVDFTPTLAETEATKGKLRGDMYKRINDALAQLNQSEPDRKYRIQSINFSYDMPEIRPKFVVARAAAMQAVPSSPEPVQLSQKVQVQAQVTFATHPPRD